MLWDDFLENYNPLGNYDKYHVFNIQNVIDNFISNIPKFKKDKCYADYFPVKVHVPFEHFVLTFKTPILLPQLKGYEHVHIINPTEQIEVVDKTIKDTELTNRTHKGSMPFPSRGYLMQVWVRRNRREWTHKLFASMITIDNDYNLIDFGVFEHTPLFKGGKLTGTKLGEFIMIKNMHKERSFVGTLDPNKKEIAMEIGVFLESWYTFFITFMFLCSRTVKEVVHTPSKELQKSRFKRGKRPLVTYKTLDVPKELYPRKGEPMGLWRNRYHSVRGHYAIHHNFLGKGIYKIVWVGDHKRGDINLGIVEKDYNVGTELGVKPEQPQMRNISVAIYRYKLKSLNRLQNIAKFFQTFFSHVLTKLFKGGLK